MKCFPKKLQQKLDKRNTDNVLRQLGEQSGLVDFSSNDYIGFSKNETLFKNTHNYLLEHKLTQNGATGSRLLTGNHTLYSTVEQQISNFHNSEGALLFNSGYDANLGFFSSVPQRGDVIFYDEYIHASIRDGITMSHAKSYKFKHNDLEHLKSLTQRHSELDSEAQQNIYIVTESVFSMDGDTPNLKALADFCTANNYYLIIDEAHAIGVFGDYGVGLVQKLNIESQLFARIITFGKALGGHGAAILGSTLLKNYLTNFSRSLIYTTGLPPHSVATIKLAYNTLLETDAIIQLQHNISFFKSQLITLQLQHQFIESDSAIQCCIIPGNATVKTIAKNIQNAGFNIKPILSPTVPKGQERLRFCLHSYNSEADITKVLSILSTFV
jgi:8-amino-7-oxononanoate synthase